MNRNSKASKSDKARGSAIRVGIGYDVHEFGPRREFILGGVRIPHLAGLVGHSDGDVLLHAICDALLGATGSGDIGKHFPNTSAKFKGISSIKLLLSVVELLKKQGFSVGNVDSMVILQRPKIGRYVSLMQKKIAKVLDVRVSQVSVKATTNEGLGFIGRGEGCAAMATALVYQQRPE